MKTISNVYDNLLNKEKIKEIILLASRGKKKRKEVIKVISNIDEYSDKIYEMLQNKTYYMLPSRNKKIMEKGKERLLTISPFYPNRILDYIIVETLKPYIRKSLYYYCVGNVDKKGIVFGKKAVARNYKKYKYYLKLDIHHFYPSVSSQKLIEFLETKIRDKRFLDLCKVVVGSCQNMPIGSYYSQWFSNWYLAQLDHKIKQECKIEFYVRYVDDMVLFSNNKRKLLNAKYFVDRWLNERGLELKKNSQTRLQGTLDFLGFKFADRVLLRKRNFKCINKRLKKIRKSKHICVSQARFLLSYCGWLKQIDCGYLYYKRKIKPYVKKGQLKKIISDYDKSHLLAQFI